MDLSDYRAQIDRIDAELLRLFAERMQTAAGIAAYKKGHALPVLDTGREREKLAGIVKAAPGGSAGGGREPVPAAVLAQPRLPAFAARQ